MSKLWRSSSEQRWSKAGTGGKRQRTGGARLGTGGVRLNAEGARLGTGRARVKAGGAKSGAGHPRKQRSVPEAYQGIVT